MSNALELENQELAKIFANLDNKDKLHVAIEVARHAIEFNNITDKFVQDCSTNPEYGSALKRKELQRIADEVESPYLDSLGKDKQILEGSPLLVLFRKARAINSLYFALSDAPEDDYATALYEAIHSGLTPDIVNSIIDSVSQP